MTLLLDTSILIELEKENRDILSSIERLSKKHERPFISFMSLVEFLTGYGMLSLEKKVKAKKFIWQFPILHTTNSTAAILSSLKYKYKSQKSMTDLFIASHAIEHNLTLITRDKDFTDINELKKVVI